jgi:alkylation response protein AidB-like acyl-CoA dehydrogenase
MLGQMGFAAEYSRRYALDRIAFGKPIAHHQALAFLIVDMRMAVDGAREMVREAAWRLQSGLPYASAAAAAFLEAIDAGLFVGPNAVQILGAAGFMRDHPVEKAMRELRTLSLLAGGADAARDDAWSDDCWAGDAAIVGDVDAHAYGRRPTELLAAEN